MGNEPDDQQKFIHNLKIRLTAISGYAQLLERQIYESAHSTERQIDYITRLRQVIDELSNTIQEHSNDKHAQRERQSCSDDGNGSSSPSNSEFLSN